jgi:simple sugar transport system substrate-binding protein
MNQAGLDRIKSGQQAFAIDQQPYLQSFWRSALLARISTLAPICRPVPVLTGPGIVDASNVDATLAGVKLGAR